LRLHTEITYIKKVDPIRSFFFSLVTKC
jgi:hypothetical protein